LGARPRLRLCDNQGVVKTTSRTPTPRSDSKRAQILDAAFHCFLQYGYQKTSLDDVARKAGISRPAIYLLFKNKIDLFHALYADLTDTGLARAEAVLRQSLSKKEKLTALCEAAILEPWSRISGQPRAAEFYGLCEQLAGAETQRVEKHKLKIAQNVFEDKEAAEIFLLALDGFYSDLPSVAVLRKRIHFLIDRFLANGSRD
jgi:AcrR family transcriptional regulator